MSFNYSMKKFSLFEINKFFVTEKLNQEKVENFEVFQILFLNGESINYQKKRKYFSSPS